MKAEIFITDTNHFPSDNLTACRSILTHCGIKSATYLSREKVMKLSKGNVSPVNGFVIIFKDNEFKDKEPIWNFFDLVKFIEEEGLRPA